MTTDNSPNSYAMNWLVVMPLEVTAVLKILEFWQNLHIPEAVTITICLVVRQPAP